MYKHRIYPTVPDLRDVARRPLLTSCEGMMLKGLSDRSVPTSDNPCGCGDKGQQAIDEWDNYLEDLERGDMQKALNDFLRYYRDIGQSLNPADYGKNSGP